MSSQAKTAIVTGASQGIGLATAKLLAKLGAKVVLAARSTDKLTALASELDASGESILALTVDLREPSAVDGMIQQSIDRFGRVDVLINNAGQAASGNIENVSMDDFRQIMELNVFSVVEAIQAVAPVMMQQSWSTADDDLTLLNPQLIPADGKVCVANPYPFPDAAPTSAASASAG